MVQDDIMQRPRTTLEELFAKAKSNQDNKNNDSSSPRIFELIDMKKDSQTDENLYYKFINIKSDRNYIDINYINPNSSSNQSIFTRPTTPPTAAQLNRLRWLARQPVAYIQPTTEQVEQVLEAVHMVESLPPEQQRQLIEATQEIRYLIDGQLRATLGGTRHYNAIRSLNNPQATDISSLLSRRNVQLAGEEYFGINRYLETLPDIADVQWWAVYAGGSWMLETTNSNGEHLDTGFDGWGNLIGSVLKVNGQVLEPDEIIAFYRTLKLRQERSFSAGMPIANMALFLGRLNQGDAPSDEALERFVDLGLVDANGRSLTYVGMSMITPTVATERKDRVLTESDPAIRPIINPFSLN